MSLAVAVEVAVEVKRLNSFYVNDYVYQITHSGTLVGKKSG